MLSDTATTGRSRRHRPHLLDPRLPLAETAAQQEGNRGRRELERLRRPLRARPEFRPDRHPRRQPALRQATGQPRFEIFPESESKFFLKVVDAQITFEPPTGAARPGAASERPSTREAQPPKPPPPPKAQKEIAVDPKILDRYVGRYQLAPEFIINITREENSLFVQATAQPNFQVFAESEREFFYKVVEATIMFAADGSSLVLHQNGMEIPGKKTD